MRPPARLNSFGGAALPSCCTYYVNLSLSLTDQGLKARCYSASLFVGVQLGQDSLALCALGPESPKNAREGSGVGAHGPPRTVRPRRRDLTPSNETRSNVRIDLV